MAAEAGSDVNAVDEDGNTALHYVVDKGFPDVVAFLTESGAKVNVENEARPDAAHEVRPPPPGGQ